MERTTRTRIHHISNGHTHVVMVCQVVLGAGVKPRCKLQAVRDSDGLAKLLISCFDGYRDGNNICNVCRM
jgi:hypothetical protein